MNLQQAIERLKLHQLWRKGEEVDMTSPSELSRAIDTILEYFEKQKDEKIR